MRYQVRTRDQQPYVSLLEGRRSRYDRLLSAQLGTSENRDKGRGVIQPVVLSVHTGDCRHLEIKHKDQGTGSKYARYSEVLEQRWDKVKIS